jgi:hypothetical protein
MPPYVTYALLALCTLGALLASRVMKKLLQGSTLTFARGALAVGAGLVLLVALVSTAERSRSPAYREGDDRTLAPTTAATQQVNLPSDGKLESKPQDLTKAAGDAAFGNFEKNNVAANGWLLPGVTPVALPLPSAQRWADTSRELVTKERPFAPRLVYVTTTGLLPFFALWLMCLGALAYLHRARIVAAHTWLRGLLAPARAPDPSPAE